MLDSKKGQKYHFLMILQRQFSSCRDTEAEGGTKAKSVLRDAEGAESYVSSIKNVTQNMVGRISNLSRGGLGGLANKFSGGFLNF